MTEALSAFGPDNVLLGVMTRPTGNLAGCAVLLSNAGLIHHCGPQDLNTTVCRRLAAEGIPTLRFDLGGIGDSYRAEQSTRYEERAVSDVGLAMSHLQERTGVKQFILAGICSGADDAHRCALHDERVAGVVQIDGYAYRTPGFYARHYGGRALDPKAYTNKMKKWVGASLVNEEPELPAPVQLNYRSFRTREEFEEDLAILNQREVRQLFIYTRSWRERCNYRNQMNDASSPKAS
ncbi:MAG: hypothetical protein AAFQ82_26460, partial [Myxococcota bacterium]